MFIAMDFYQKIYFFVINERGDSRCALRFSNAVCTILAKTVSSNRVFGNKTRLVDDVMKQVCSLRRRDSRRRFHLDPSSGDLHQPIRPTRGSTAAHT